MIRSTSSPRAVTMTIGHGRVAAERADDVEAVDLGQAEVEHDGVGPARAGQREAAGAVARGEHGEAGVFEIVADERRDLRLVLDDQDRAHWDAPKIREAPGGRYRPGAA